MSGDTLAPMCGRFVLAKDYDEVERELNASHFCLMPNMSWNVKPMDDAPIVGQDIDGHNRLQTAQWSLIPPDAPTHKPEYPTHNARIETALTRPTFSRAAHWQRALIPVSGFYEWDSDRQPWYFHDPSHPTIYLAGLYSWWHEKDNPNAPWLLTFTILTCDSTQEAGRIHKRMPVIVGDDDFEPWLARRLDGTRIIPTVHKAAYGMAERLDEHRVAPIHGDTADNIRPLAAC